MVLEVNGVEVADEWFDGLVDYPVSVELPASLLESDGNTLRIALPHDTGAPYDLVHYNHYRVTLSAGLRRPRRSAHLQGDAEAYRVDGLPSPEVVVYREVDGRPCDTRVEPPGQR